MACLAAGLVVPAGLAAEDHFTNPIAEGADPFVVLHEGRYIWCQSEGNRGVALWISDRLTSLGSRHIVWTPPKSGPFSREIWAPEHHFLDGRWHIYVAASDGRNENHLTYVLRSETSDPLSVYEIHGPMATGQGADGRSPNVWAIDMTVLEHRGKRYGIWSGWDAPGTDRQFLYIAPMASPVKLSGPRVLICDNDDHLWERTEERAESRGLHEGPQVLQHGGRTFLIYSCGASWLPTYKLGLLELVGDDPLLPSSWKKHPEPVFRSSEKTFGVGHGGFVQSPDGAEWWHVYHAKRDRRPGWRRSIFVQPFRFDDSGFPDFGRPVDPGSTLPLPSGSVKADPRLPLARGLRDGREVPGFSYYGHQQFLSLRRDGAHLGCVPDQPVNDYRCGEKLVLDGGDFTDFRAAVNVRFINGDRDAGLLFRVSDPAVGYDAQSGYFAGLVPKQNRIVLGRTDGSRWHEIARADVPMDPGRDHRLEVAVRGSQIAVMLDGERHLLAEDETHARGSVGLRVVDTHARFSDLEVTRLEASEPDSTNP